MTLHRQYVYILFSPLITVKSVWPVLAVVYHYTNKQDNIILLQYKYRIKSCPKLHLYNFYHVIIFAKCSNLYIDSILPTHISSADSIIPLILIIIIFSMFTAVSCLCPFAHNYQVFSIKIYIP